MIEAGKLDRVITIERATNDVDASGVVTQTWATHILCRAQMVNEKIDDVERAYGAATDSTLWFKTRWVADITLEDRVNYGGTLYLIKELQEIQRRRGWNIRVERPSA